MLGWNIPYGFNDSDFEVSENLLSIYLDEYEETPWDALKYLVSPALPLLDQICPLKQLKEKVTPESDFFFSLPLKSK